MLTDPPAGLASASTRGSVQFTGQVAFATADEDSNGLTEALAVDVGVRVLEAGHYKIEGFISRQGEHISSGQCLDQRLFSPYVLDGAPGTYVARLKFCGDEIFEHGKNGPYVVKLWARSFCWADDTVECLAPLGPQDTLECLTPSYPYTIFGEVMAALTSATDRGVDLDGDGKYDVLRTTLHILARAPGTFTVSGGLCRDYVSIADSEVSVSLKTGDQTVTLDFYGAKIRKQNLNGPYYLTVCIRDTVGNFVSSLLHTTRSYSASEFDVSALTPTLRRAESANGFAPGHPQPWSRSARNWQVI